ncbi:MAG: 2-dehydropantoate 2-reductase [Opitutus sp.]
MSVPFRNVAVIGAGAIGIYYGVKLGRSGAAVRFLLRSDLSVVQSRGTMSIHDASGTVELRPAAVYGNVNEIGPVDLVLVSVKTTANQSLPDLLPPLLGPETSVLTFQNGLGAEETIASIVGEERVLGGLAFIALNRTAPGEVRCFHHGSLILGQFGRPPSKRTRDLAHQLTAAGIKVDVAENLATARWQKLVWNIPFNGLAIAAGGLSTDVICADPKLAERVHVLMREVQQAALALGHVIRDDFLQRQFEVTPPMGAYRPSSLVDFLAGREVELESIWGEPLRRAEAVGADVPELKKLYGELQQAIVPRNAMNDARGHA